MTIQMGLKVLSPFIDDRKSQVIGDKSKWAGNNLNLTFPLDIIVIGRFSRRNESIAGHFLNDFLESFSTIVKRERKLQIRNRQRAKLICILPEPQAAAARSETSPFVDSILGNAAGVKAEVGK